jgi:hypothetical protein
MPQTGSGSQTTRWRIAEIAVILQNVSYSGTVGKMTYAFPLSQLSDGHVVGDWLHEHWTGRRGPVEWPPRSPDLTMQWKHATANIFRSGLPLWAERLYYKQFTPWCSWTGKKFAHLHQRKWYTYWAHSVATVTELQHYLWCQNLQEPTKAQTINLFTHYQHWPEVTQCTCHE